MPKAHAPERWFQLLPHFHGRRELHHRHASIHAIARGLPALTELNLRGCRDVKEPAIASLQAVLPKLMVELPWLEIDDDDSD